MDIEKVNLRGPSTMVLESFVCSECGKKRSTGNSKGMHTKCSKAKQRRFAELKNEK